MIVGRDAPLSIGIAVFALLFSLVPIAIGSFYDTFTAFLGYLGAVFAPLLAILIVDYYLIRRGRYRQPALADKTGPYWYVAGVNWYTVGTWAAGVAAFFTAQRIPALQDTIGAVVSALVFTLVAYYVVARVAVSRGAYSDLPDGGAEPAVQTDA